MSNHETPSIPPHDDADAPPLIQEQQPSTSEAQDQISSEQLTQLLADPRVRELFKTIIRENTKPTEQPVEDTAETLQDNEQPAATSTTDNNQPESLNETGSASAGNSSVESSNVDPDSSNPNEVDEDSITNEAESNEVAPDIKNIFESEMIPVINSMRYLRESVDDARSKFSTRFIAMQREKAYFEDFDRRIDNVTKRMETNPQMRKYLIFHNPDVTWPAIGSPEDIILMKKGVGQIKSSLRKIAYNLEYTMRSPYEDKFKSMKIKGRREDIGDNLNVPLE